MIKIDENDPIGEVDPSFPFRDVNIKRNTDMKEFYDLQKEIGRGKFGTVYRCTEKSTGLKLAAKFIGISKRQDRRNAEREVEIMRELQHPRLIQMYDAYEINNVMCVVLELIEGGELFERVIDDDFVLTEKSVSVFMRQICEGIAFIHSKDILHLDMKPENILCLTRTGNRIKIIDFGLARKYDPQKKLQVLFGTPEFVAPEVVNFDSIGFGTDMWSVGVICYVLLSGLSPFMGETDVQTMANVTIAQYDFDDEAFIDISADAKDFIGKLLLKDREQRMSATECLSHCWLQRRKAVSGVNPSYNPIPQNSELDIQRDKPMLRNLVDRWNNDTNITLVNGDVDENKRDKIIDICKTMNGISDEQSKLQNEIKEMEKSDFVAEKRHGEYSQLVGETDEKRGDDRIELGSPIPKKQPKLESTLVPIQCVEAPIVSNQVLKSLIDDAGTSEEVPIAANSTLSVNGNDKDDDMKIRESPTPQRSGVSSPSMFERPVFDDKLKLCNGHENFISIPMEEQICDIEINHDDQISSEESEETSELHEENDGKLDTDDGRKSTPKLVNCDKPTKNEQLQENPGVESRPIVNLSYTKDPQPIIAGDDGHDVQTYHTKLDIPNGNLTPDAGQRSKSHSPVVEISDESYECVKKRRFVIKNVESKESQQSSSTLHVESHETRDDSAKTSPTRRSPFTPEREHSPKVFRKFNDLMSTSELMKRRISDISSLLSKTEQKLDHSFSEDMSSFCHRLNKIVRLRHDSYSIETEGSTFKRPKFRISYFSRDVPLASSAPYHADLLNYLPLRDETISTPVWSFQKTNPFHSDPSSLRNSPERFGHQPSLTKKILSKFFSDSLEYDISSSTPSSSHGLPKDKITGIIS